MNQFFYGIIFLVYGAGFFSIVYGIIRLVLSYVKFAKTFNGTAKDSILAWVFNVTKKVKYFASKNKIEELTRIRPNYARFFNTICMMVVFLINAPIFFIQMGLVLLCGNVEFLWWLPLSLYDIWHIFIIIFSFYLAVSKFYYLSIFIAFLMVILGLSEVLDNFKRDEEGKMRIEVMPKHKIRILSILIDFLIIILAYGAIYFSIFNINNNTFAKSLTIFDSVYFSFITISTVGYGDIAPTNVLSKALVVSEIIVGYTFLVIVFAVYINVWIRRTTESEKK